MSYPETSTNQPDQPVGTDQVIEVSLELPEHIYQALVAHVETQATIGINEAFGDAVTQYLQFQNYLTDGFRRDMVSIDGLGLGGNLFEPTEPQGQLIQLWPITNLGA